MRSQSSSRHSARRTLAAGFELVEIHAAHGYLINEFLSSLSNRRTDQYGGTFENRIRFALEVTAAIREVWPERLPLFMRISVTDWVDGGWDVEQSVALVRVLRARGVDLIDCSSGGVVLGARCRWGRATRCRWPSRSAVVPGCSRRPWG